MRTFGAVLLASSLMVTGAFAAPLAPGKPAGVKKAQMEHNTLLIVLGVGIVAGGIALVASNGNGSGVTSTTSATVPTSGTNP